ncbi:DNA polymerase IV [Naumannella sp. ID2617S]|uniref:DNA polymerase IV n=1 Tax=Enemella dayhoffiae TaxID=2016507 RepID=A0A255HCG8_9ACTN|nr:DNA polymerase IV [Enemella dayhoffiae]NNG18564.1 DNA polymerase IV [Naumannella sp. ID2617S]OYO24653.1 DNA polymerase IV [Enemella dayhoffiae]
MSVRSTVLHVDMDAFYVGVELRRRPELVGRPVLVGGATRGVVLSASYQARESGVEGGMPMTRARRLCPQAVVLPPDFEAYAETSRGVFAIFEAITPGVEPMSIDEAFLDVSGSTRLLGSPARIGELIRAKVFDEQGITCSVGIGPSKFVAKLASSAAKPDGLHEVAPDRVVEFLHPLPVTAIWGVGEATAEKLHRLGLRTVADLAYLPKTTLQRGLGVHLGGLLADLAWGRDNRAVTARPAERSIGSEHTFGRDTDDAEVVRRELLRMADRTTSRMRAAGMLGRSVVITVRFADYSQLTRTGSLRTPTDGTKEVYARAIALWESLGLARARVRKVGVRVAGLVPAAEAYCQPELTEPEHGWRDAERAMDAAIARFGPRAVRRAALG